MHFLFLTKIGSLDIFRVSYTIILPQALRFCVWVIQERLQILSENSTQAWSCDGIATPILNRRLTYLWRAILFARIDYNWMHGCRTIQGKVWQ